VGCRSAGTAGLAPIVKVFKFFGEKLRRGRRGLEAILNTAEPKGSRSRKGVGDSSVFVTYKMRKKNGLTRRMALSETFTRERRVLSTAAKKVSVGRNTESLTKSTTWNDLSEALPNPGDLWSPRE